MDKPQRFFAPRLGDAIISSEPPRLTADDLAEIARLAEPHMATGTTNGTIVGRALTINGSLPTPDFIEYNGVRFVRERSDG